MVVRIEKSLALLRCESTLIAIEGTLFGIGRRRMSCGPRQHTGADGDESQCNEGYCEGGHDRAPEEIGVLTSGPVS